MPSVNIFLLIIQLDIFSLLTTPVRKEGDHCGIWQDHAIKLALKIRWRF